MSLNIIFNHNLAEVDLVSAGIDADYSSYAAFYACAGITGLGRAQVGWIASRKRTLDQASVNKAMQAFKAQNLLPGITPVLIEQTGCKN